MIHFVTIFGNSGDDFARKRAALYLVAYTLDRLVRDEPLSDLDRRAIYDALPSFFEFDEGLARTILGTLGRSKQSWPSDHSPQAEVHTTESDHAQDGSAI